MPILLGVGGCSLAWHIASESVRLWVFMGCSPEHCWQRCFGMLSIFVSCLQLGIRVFSCLSSCADPRSSACLDALRLDAYPAWHGGCSLARLARLQRCKPSSRSKTRQPGSAAADTTEDHPLFSSAEDTFSIEPWCRACHISLRLPCPSRKRV